MADSSVTVQLLPDRVLAAIGRLVVACAEAEEAATLLLEAIQQREPAFGAGKKAFAFDVIAARIDKWTRMTDTDLARETGRCMSDLDQVRKQRHLAAHGIWLPRDAAEAIMQDREALDWIAVKRERDRPELVGARMTEDDLRRLASDCNQLADRLKSLITRHEAQP